MLSQCTAVVQMGHSGDDNSVLNPQWPRNSMIVPRISTVTKYKIEKISVNTGDRTISVSRDSNMYHSSTLAQVIVGISCIYVWTTTALKDWLYFPTIRIRPVVYEKHWTGSQIRISVRITPNFELGLPMIITSLLTKFHQKPTSSLWEILLTNKHTKVIALSRFSRDNKFEQCTWKFFCLLSSKLVLKRITIELSKSFVCNICP